MLAAIFALLDPRFRGGELFFVALSTYPLIPAHSRPKDGVLSYAYGGTPVFENRAGRDKIRGRFHRHWPPKNGPVSELPDTP
jgi:hypothetical protein